MAPFVVWQGLQFAPFENLGDQKGHLQRYAP
jgi:hypothetical protein